MSILIKLFFVSFIILIPKFFFGETFKIEITKNDSYSPKIIQLEIGDIIEWVPQNDGHNVEFILAPREVSLPIKSKINKPFLYKFIFPGVYLYGCTPHMEMGMIGVVVVNKNYHNLDEIKKVKISNVTNSVLQKILDF